MHWVRYALLIVVATRMAVLADTVPQIPAADHPLIRSVLDQHYIPVTLTATVPVPFAVVTHLFEQEDILDTIQEEYARLLPPGESPEFVVQQDAPNQWSYVNRKNQPSVITEVFRDTSHTSEAEAVFHTSGRRFFGQFEALTHVRLYESGEDTRYHVYVYAYPKSDTVRFFARHLGLVRRFFEEKTVELSDLTAQIAGSIIPRTKTAAYTAEYISD